MSIVQLFPEATSSTPDELLKENMGHFQDVMILGYNGDNLCRWSFSKDFTNESLVFLLEALKTRIIIGEA